MPENKSQSPAVYLPRRSARLAGMKNPLEFYNVEVPKVSSPRKRRATTTPKKKQQRARSASRGPKRTTPQKNPRSKSSNKGIKRTASNKKATKTARSKISKKAPKAKKSPRKKSVGKKNGHVHSNGAKCDAETGAAAGQLALLRINKAFILMGVFACSIISAALLVGKFDTSTNANLFLVLGLFVLLTIFLAVDSIPQDEEYHNFADQRVLCNCIPNYMDVLSNIPFFLVGVVGLDALFPGQYLPKDVTAMLDRNTAKVFQSGLNVQTSEEKDAWAVFFVGVLLVSVGSGYYHWYRTSSTLVWDRVQMTVAFMSTFALQCMERLGTEYSWILWPAVAIGAGSVFWWHFSGDLRLYIVVQFFPLVSMPLLIASFPARYTRSELLLVALAFYLICKIVEHYDKQIFRLTGRVVSGHTLKHLTAAVSPLVAIYYLSVRESI